MLRQRIDLIETKEVRPATKPKPDPNLIETKEVRPEPCHTRRALPRLDGLLLTAATLLA